MARLCAFKNPAYGTYHVFVDEALATIEFDPNNPDRSKWMDATLLNSLNQSQLNKIVGFDLIMFSDVEDDVYNINISNYDILQTTDDSHFILGGYASLNAMTFNNTSTTNHVILSFDGRKTWWYLDIAESKWKKTYLSQIYTDKSNTVEEINKFTKTTFDPMFKKYCTLDFAMSLNNNEYFGDVVLTLPPNQGPQIKKLTITGDVDQTGEIETHKNIVKVIAEVDDMEGDQFSYKILRSFNGATPAIVDKEIASGDCDNTKTKFTFNLDPADFEIGVNIIKFVFTDEKNASTSKTINITKINENAILAASLVGDKLSYTVIDNDTDDGGKIRIRIKYSMAEEEKIENDNGNTKPGITVIKNYEYIITPEYIPLPKDQDPFDEIHDDEGWSEHINAPININETIKIPWETIGFAVENEIIVEYKEDIYNAPTKIQSIKFTGSYFGLLFVDNTQPFKISNVPNKDFYYSTSLGETIKKLDLLNTYHTKNSITKEVGLINLSDEIIPKAVIRGFEDKDKHYRVCVSSTENFNMSSLTEIAFRNIYPYDPDNINEDNFKRFYVKLFSLDKTNWKVDDFVKVTTVDEDIPVITVEDDSQSSPEETT